MRHEIQVERSFSASHQLRLYDGMMEPLHGHNWQVQVTVGADELDGIDVVMDFHELQRQMDAIIGQMHNTHLNDLQYFSEHNPSAEQVAITIAQAISLPDRVKLLTVQVWETPDCAAVYHP